MKNYLNKIFGEKPVEIRGHHLFHLNEFDRTGKTNYDSEYGKDFYFNEVKVFAKILFGKYFRGPKVKIVADLDDLCKLCPKKKGCEKTVQENIEYDTTFAKAAGLDIGKVYDSKTVLGAIQSQNFQNLRPMQKYAPVLDSVVKNILERSKFLTIIGYPGTASKYLKQFIEIKDKHSLNHPDFFTELHQLLENYHLETRRIESRMKDEEIEEANLISDTLNIMDVIF